jgi:two-component system, chemotaxis family, chemotaxis protein CheY
MAKVMIVDDSGYARRVHRGILESGGHSVVEASTGLGALETYFLEKPDVVVLDLSMEDMGGVDVLKRLREMDVTARAIVVSADVQRTTEEQVLEAGARRFIGKPVDAGRLLREVNAVLDAPASNTPEPR